MAESEVVIKDEMEVDEDHKEQPPAAGSPSSALADGDDEVVAEIDVVLTNLSSDLSVYLAQYPLRPPWRPYDPEDLTQVRFKRQHHLLEMDYELTLDTSVATQAMPGTVTVDGMDVDGEQEAKLVDASGNEIKKKMQKHTIRSSAVPLRTNYAVGLYRDNALYLTPLTGILQMRPSFAELEDEAEKARKQLDDYSAQKVADNIGLQVKKRAQDDKAAAMRDKSYFAMKQLEAEDPWRILDFVERDRDEAVGIFEEIASTQEVSKAAFNVSRQEYLAMINPVQAQLEQEQKRLIQAEREMMDPDSTHQGDATQQKKKKKDIHESDLIPRLSAISASGVLDPAMQIKAIMWNCGIATFSTLRRLTGARNDAEFARLLDASCVFVSGRWLLKSDIVCKSERLAMARQALLVQWALDDKARISRLAHANLWRIDPEDLKKILLPIADLLPPVYEIDLQTGERVETMSPGWILKLASDHEPAGHYEKLEKRYKSIWRDIGLQLEKQIDNLQCGSVDGVGIGLGLGSGHKALDGALFENRAAVDPAVSNELQTIIRNLIATHNVIKLDFLRQQITAKAHAGELKHVPANVSDVILKQELSVCAEMIHDVWVRRCGADWGLKDENYRRAVYNLFAAAKDRKIKRKDVENAILTQSGASIPRNTYTVLMRELAVIVGGWWVLKNGDGTQQASEKESANDDL
eukprot:TRINITY_DN7398_c0_g1_i1.p1 TRINITY_DN7398_c0_g1~~TRINITY_DN7398_c0_g1_i1.p1  ORF type:complete len:693 (-),score=180.61 TRINITY_DN7398_c0_g1_i1:114-2192(-)